MNKSVPDQIAEDSLEGVSVCDHHDAFRDKKVELPQGSRREPPNGFVDDRCK